MGSRLREPILQASLIVLSGALLFRSFSASFPFRLTSTYGYLFLSLILVALFGYLVYARMYAGYKGSSRKLVLVFTPRDRVSYRRFREVEDFVYRAARALGIDDIEIRTQGGRGRETRYTLVLGGEGKVLETMRKLVFSFDNHFFIQEKHVRADGIAGFEAEFPYSSNTPPVFAVRVEDLAPVFLSESDFERHIGVFGTTGSGKTTTVAVLSRIISSYYGIHVLIFDWHGEYKRLLSRFSPRVLDPSKGHLKLNPLLNGDLESVMNILDDVLDLSAPQSSILYRTLREKRPSDLHELVLVLEGIGDQGYWEREVRQAILRKLEFIETEEGRMVFGPRKGFTSIDMETSGFTVVDLSGLKSLRIRRLFPLFLLREIYSRVLDKGERLRVVIALDEAHVVLPRHTDNFVSRMIAEVRKFGASFIISTQSPSGINVEFLKNFNTWIIHAIKNSVDKELVLSSIPGGGAYLDILPGLRPGEALFSPASSPSSFLIRIDSSLLS